MAEPQPHKPERWWLEFAVPTLVLLGVLAVVLLLLPAEKQPEGAFPDHEFPAMLTVDLDMSKRDMAQLQMQRLRALRRGLLITDEDPWVGAILREGSRKYPVRVRLKGDWTDHLEEGKWSLRIALKDTLAWRRLRVFSVQNPRTRNMLDEWLLHKAMAGEGVLSPRYDFVRLRLRGANLGIYALEEHFSKEMVEAQSLREAPVYRFNEAGMWATRLRAMQDPEFPYMETPFYAASQPEAFQATRWQTSTQRQAIHGQGISLMRQYKAGTAPAREVFDLASSASFYALIDLFRGHHALVWHNRRYYYDPMVSRLRPVGYDAFAGEISGSYLNGPFTGYACRGTTRYGSDEDLLGTTFFGDSTFVRLYYEKLHAFTEPAYLDSLLAQLQPELDQREAYLQREFPFYRFDQAKYRRYAAEIRAGLEDSLRMAALHWQHDQSSWCLDNELGLPLQVMAVRYPGDSLVRLHDLLDAWDRQLPPDRIEFGIRPAEVQLKVPGGSPFWLRCGE